MFCAPQHRLKWEWYLCFCRCIWPQHKLKEDDPPFDPERPERLYMGYNFKDFIEDDGSCVGCFQRPVRVGASILIYGRRNSRWPWQCMAGPDWPGTILVLVLIFGVHAIVLGTCTTCLGWVVQFLGWTGCFSLVIVYLSVAFSNPGLVLKTPSEDPPMEMTKACEHSLEEGNAGVIHIEDGSSTEEGILGLVKTSEALTDECNSEDSVPSSSSSLLAPGKAGNDAGVSSSNENGKLSRLNPITSSTVVPQASGASPNPRTVSCGQCQIQRPLMARHCQHCGGCIVNIDHHCPWSGKCIAEKNMNAFNSFLCLLCFETYFLMGVFVYYWVACWTPLKLPTGERA